MTCISAIKSHMVLKMTSNGVKGIIIPSCMGQLVLVLRKLTKPIEFREKYGKIRGIRRKNAYILATEIGNK